MNGHLNIRRKTGIRLSDILYVKILPCRSILGMIAAVFSLCLFTIAPSIPPAFADNGSGSENAGSAKTLEDKLKSLRDRFGTAQTELSRLRTTKGPLKPQQIETLRRLDEDVATQKNTLREIEEAVSSVADEKERQKFQLQLGLLKTDISDLQTQIHNLWHDTRLHHVIESASEKLKPGSLQRSPILRYIVDSVIIVLLIFISYLLYRKFNESDRKLSALEEAVQQAPMHQEQMVRDAVLSSLEEPKVLLQNQFQQTLRELMAEYQPSSDTDAVLSSLEELKADAEELKALLQNQETRKEQPEKPPPAQE